MRGCEHDAKKAKQDIPPPHHLTIPHLTKIKPNTTALQNAYKLGCTACSK
jgi:hypothetical protein